MTQSSAHTFLGVATDALAVLALAGCGSSVASTASPQPPKSTTGTPASVGVALRPSKPERISSPVATVRPAV